MKRNSASLFRSLSNWAWSKSGAHGQQHLQQKIASDWGGRHTGRGVSKRGEAANQFTEDHIHQGQSLYISISAFCTEPDPAFGLDGMTNGTSADRGDGGGGEENIVPSLSVGEDSDVVLEVGFSLGSGVGRGFLGRRGAFLRFGDGGGGDGILRGDCGRSAADRRIRRGGVFLPGTGHFSQTN